jgi:hypothetical protein
MRLLIGHLKATHCDTTTSLGKGAGGAHLGGIIPQSAPVTPLVAVEAQCKTGGESSQVPDGHEQRSCWSALGAQEDLIEELLWFQRVAILLLFAGLH